MVTEAQATRSLPLALMVEARPKQWIKNILVFAAPGAAGVLTEAEPLLQATLAFVAFSLAASGTYYLNDASDVLADRAHPVKRHRPVAAGEIPLPLARVVGVGLLIASVALALAVRTDLAIVVSTYVVLTSAYSTWLKHIAVVDMVAVAAGFVLRAVGGAVAVDVPISDWFFIVTSAASVFMVAGKRMAELRAGGDDPGSVRAILDSYSETYLRLVSAVAIGIAILAYCLWAFEQAALRTDGAVWFELSIVPFVVALLRYALLVDVGRGGEPEDLVLHDPTLLVVGVIWLGCFASGVQL